MVRTITSVEPEESDIINLLKIDHPMVHLNLFEEVPDVQRFIYDHMDNVDGWETIGSVVDGTLLRTRFGNSGSQAKTFNISST